MGFPCALMPSTVMSVTPPPRSSYVRVSLCGGGPGSYVDCATLSFQVPILGSLSCADRFMTETTSVRTTPNVNVRSSDCIVLLLLAHVSNYETSYTRDTVRHIYGVFQRWRDTGREAHQTLFEQREDRCVQSSL